MAIDRYLYTHYKGKYRVLPELDIDTQDFLRDCDGDIDEDYSDFYLIGKSKIKIKHGVGSTLACYIPSTGTGHNVVCDYCKLMCNKEYKGCEKDVAAKKAASLLIKNGFIDNIDFLYGEIYFEFNAKYLDDLNKIIKLRTGGANISPLSSKNLPKPPYEIPNKDMDKYKKAKEGIEPLALGRLNIKFGEENVDNYKSELKKSRLKAMQFFHKEGLWDEYCKWLKGVER